ncbi:uncharacterized protein SAPINGB_P005519 [Magnusiomyces paraingens]|uniref:Long chronological lifespan protein 2 n=1 Tax=Magnusiomyces paraingens TaxID=2606893 RepID=A0A5E8C267_9ASCO|nr:uncharacterized protein SAPINGB_P005519 [Saprochaete ingens]VVT57070.1 unnamed protein product [Saprochaete ingens]
MKSLFSIVISLFTFMLFVGPAAAQFENIFQNLFRQQQQHQRPAIPKVSDSYYQSDCDKYLCQDTLACVATPVDCPCLWPDSQIKCILPNKKNYVCISRPAPGDPAPRDCAFVNKAYKGTV